MTVNLASMTSVRSPVWLIAVMAVVFCGAGYGNAEEPVTDILPDMEFVEFRESFEAGTTGNRVVFRVENTTAYPVESLSLRPQLPAQYLTLDHVEPQTLDLDPGQKAEIIVEFSVRKGAAEGAEDIIEFHFEAESPNPVPIPRYRLVATIEGRGEETCIYRCPRNLSLAELKQCRIDPASHGFQMERVCFGATARPEVFAGRYQTQGVGDGGQPYEGETLIIGTGFEVYKVIQNIGGDQMAGYGFIDGRGRLVVDFSNAGICAAYAPGPGGRLDGQWGAKCDQWTGKEQLLPF